MSLSTRDPELPALTPSPATVSSPHEGAGAPSGQTMTWDTELPRVKKVLADDGVQRGQRIALSVLLVLSFLVAAWVASGLWVSIALGTVMAFTAQPAYRSLSQRIGDRRGLSAGLVTLAMGLFAGAMAMLFLYIAVDELVTIGGLLERTIKANTLAGVVGEPAAKVVDKLGISRAVALAKIHSGLGAAASYAAGWAATVLEAGTGAVLGLIMALLTMYYVLLEWRTLIMRIERTLPLNPRHTRALILEFREVGRGVLVGTVTSAIVQGLLGGIAYVVLGVPQALTWGVATGFASFLPVLGTSIVWGPVGAYMILNGDPFAGVCVLVWGLLVVTMATDYVIRPRLLGRRVGHPLLVLIALLGGIEVLGLAGLLVGPILMSLFLAVLRIYDRERLAVTESPHEQSEASP